MQCDSQSQFLLERILDIFCITNIPSSSIGLENIFSCSVLASECHGQGGVLFFGDRTDILGNPEEFCCFVDLTCRAINSNCFSPCLVHSSALLLE